MGVWEKEEGRGMTRVSMWGWKGLWEYGRQRRAEGREGRKGEKGQRDKERKRRDEKTCGRERKGGRK